MPPLKCRRLHPYCMSPADDNAAVDTDVDVDGPPRTCRDTTHRPGHPSLSFHLTRAPVGLFAGSLLCYSGSNILACAGSEGNSEHECVLSACLSSSDVWSPSSTSDCVPSHSHCTHRTRREPSDAEEVPASPNLVECTPNADIATLGQCSDTKKGLILQGIGCLSTKGVVAEYGCTSGNPSSRFELQHQVEDAIKKLKKPVPSAESTNHERCGTSDGSGYFSNLLELARAAEEQRHYQSRPPLSAVDPSNLSIAIFLATAADLRSGTIPVSPKLHSRISISSCDLRYSRLLLVTGSVLQITPQRLSLEWRRLSDRRLERLKIDSNVSCQQMLSELLRVSACECDIFVYVSSIADQCQDNDRGQCTITNNVARPPPLPAGSLSTFQPARVCVPNELVSDIVVCNAPGPRPQQICVIPEVFLDEYRCADSNQAMHFLKALHSVVVDCSESTQSGALRRRGKECNMCSAIVPTGFFCPGHVANWPNHVQCLVPGCSWHESTKSGNYNKHRHQQGRHPSIKSHTAPFPQNGAVDLNTLPLAAAAAIAAG